MEIITERPIIREDSSNASGKFKAWRESRKEGKQDRKNDRSEKRAERKESRIEKRAERKTRRKANSKARKLKLDRNQDGSITFKDFIPKLNKNRNSNTGLLDVTKKNPDGSIDKVKEKDIVEVGGEAYDKNDIDGLEVKKDSKGETYVDVPKEQTEEVEFTNGDVGFTRKKGMSKGLKIGLIVGSSALVLGLITFFVVKASKKK